VNVAVMSIDHKRPATFSSSQFPCVI